MFFQCITTAGENTNKQIKSPLNESMGSLKVNVTLSVVVSQLWPPSTEPQIAFMSKRHYTKCRSVKHPSITSSLAHMLDIRTSSQQCWRSHVQQLSVSIKAKYKQGEEMHRQTLWSSFTTAEKKARNSVSLKGRGSVMSVHAHLWFSGCWYALSGVEEAVERKTLCLFHFLQIYTAHNSRLPIRG